MATNGSKKFEGVAYQEQGETYYDDGREIELLHFVYSHPKLASMRGNPQAVLDAIDEFGRTKKYLMNIGEYKSKTVVDRIRQHRPETFVECGAYVGYSAIAFGAAVKEAGGKRYWSLEHNAEFAAVTTMLVDLAGLSDLVKVVVGAVSDSVTRLHKEGKLKKIDFLFLDHLKHLYTTDLKLCEELGVVGPGSVYAADNVVKPGNPEYLEYVRSGVGKKRDRTQITSGRKGNPNLIYESEFVEGWEPSGVPDAIEITKCTGVDTSKHINAERLS